MTDTKFTYTIPIYHSLASWVLNIGLPLILIFISIVGILGYPSFVDWTLVVGAVALIVVALVWIYFFLRWRNPFQIVIDTDGLSVTSPVGRHDTFSWDKVAHIVGENLSPSQPLYAIYTALPFLNIGKLSMNSFFWRLWSGQDEVNFFYVILRDSRYVALPVPKELNESFRKFIEARNIQGKPANIEDLHQGKLSLSARIVKIWLYFFVPATLALSSFLIYYDEMEATYLPEALGVVLFLLLLFLVFCVPSILMLLLAYQGIKYRSTILGGRTATGVTALIAITFYLAAGLGLGYVGLMIIITLFGY